MKPYVERKFAKLRIPTLAVNAFATITLQPPVNHVLTIERLSYEADWVEMDVTMEAGISICPVPPAFLSTIDTIWHMISSVPSGGGAILGNGIYVNEELNLTIEGGRNVHVQVQNTSGDGTPVFMVVMYRIEKRETPGETHG